MRLLFTGQEMVAAMTRLNQEKLRVASQDDDTPKKPKPLESLTKWETFWEEWKSFTGRVRGAAMCPIAWIHREDETVTPAIYAAVYADHDARLMATTIMRGGWFELDNARAYDEFKALVLKGPGWSFIKQYDRTKNGRAAILALKRQCEGTSAVQTRKAIAYSKIATARYSGQKRQFTFDQYVEMHQEAHNTLADLQETVPENKKVTDFLSGITDPRLMNAKDLVLGDPVKLQNFEACQQYLKTLVYNKATQDKHERNISGLITDPKGGGKNNNKKRGKSDSDKASTNKDILVRNYTKEEWFKLSKEQRERVKEAHNAKKGRKEEQARQAAAVATPPPPPVPAPPAPTALLGPASMLIGSEMMHRQ